MLPNFGGRNKSKEKELEEIRKVVSSTSGRFHDPATGYLQHVVGNVSMAANTIEKAFVEQDDNFKKLFDLLERSVERGEHIFKVETKLLDQIAQLTARAAIQRDKTNNPEKKAQLQKTLDTLEQLSVSVRLENQPPVDRSEGSALGQDLFGKTYRRDLAEKIADANAKGKSYGMVKKMGFYTGRAISQPFKDIYQDLVGPEEKDKDPAKETFKTKLSRAMDSERILDEISRMKDNLTPPEVKERKEPRSIMRGKRWDGKKNAIGLASKRSEAFLEAILREMVHVRYFLQKQTQQPQQQQVAEASKPSKRKSQKERDPITGRFVKKENRPIAQVVGVDKNLDDDFAKLSSSVDKDGKTLSDEQAKANRQTKPEVARRGPGMFSGIAATLGAGIVGKTVAKFVAKRAAKKAALKAGAKVVAKGVGKKAAAKAIAKGAGKTALKKLPGIGLIIGAGLGVKKLMQGDLTGAGMEVASGAASTLPGAGTAASLGIDAAIEAREIKRAKIEKSTNPSGDAVEAMTDNAATSNSNNNVQPIVQQNTVVQTKGSQPDLSDFVGQTRSPDNSFMRFQDKRQTRVI